VPANCIGSGAEPAALPALNAVIPEGDKNHWVLVIACTATPLTAEPVRLASVPLTVTVEFGPGMVGVIPVIEMASALC
jgi:hypothetical protein